jgi:uncharacterized protein YdaU (DUF1376 family)
MSRPWFPFYHGDFVRDTLDLDAFEIGCYMLLLCHYYAHGCLPNSSKTLAKVARATDKQWSSVAKALAPKFKDGWINKRVEQELVRQDDIAKKRRSAGRSGGLRTQERLRKHLLKQIDHNHNHIESPLASQSEIAAPQKEKKAASEVASQEVLNPHGLTPSDELVALTERLMKRHVY